MGTIQWELGCPIVLDHHLTKPQRSQETGEFHNRSDKDIFGSAFLTAGVDHCFRLEKLHKEPDAKDDRMLYCDTQRGDLISENMRLRLLGPDPLYFVQVSKHLEEKTKITHLLNECKKEEENRGLAIDEIVVKSKFSRSLVYNVMKELKDELGDRLEKYGTKRKFYRILD